MLSILPPMVDLETTIILKKLVEARSHLAELKGYPKQFQTSRC